MNFRIPYTPPIEVLIVDDAGIQRSVNRMCVGEAFTGAEITLAADGQEALEAFYSGRVPHLLITDIQMPGMDGDILIRKLRGAGETVAIIIMTALVRDRSVLSLVEEFDGILYVEKPIRPFQFAAELNAMGESIASK